MDFGSPAYFSALRRAIDGLGVIDGLRDLDASIGWTVAATASDPAAPLITYRVVIAAGRVTLEVPSGGAAQVELLTDRETAGAMARGALRAQEAVSQGRLKVRGNVELLTRAAPLLAAIAPPNVASDVVLGVASGSVPA
jgi:hypothetical protein